MNRLNISEEQEKNLRILADYLLSGNLQAGFCMSTYTDIDIELNEDTFTDCGTGGCAAGHGPYAGIPKLKTEAWHEYVFRCFVGKNNDVIRNWCFGGIWADFDNTPEGAGKRILYVLDPNIQYDLEICDLVFYENGWHTLAVEKYNSIKP